MTVGLTNCQLQGVYNIRTYDVCWGLHGGGGGRRGAQICNENTFKTPSTNA